MNKGSPTFDNPDEKSITRALACAGFAFA